MKKCQTDETNSEFKITKLTFKLFDLDKTEGVMKDIYDFMKGLLTDTFGYHWRLKSFIKAASYVNIQFTKNSDINEVIAEVDVNSLFATVMTKIKIKRVILKKC
jgi:hypothetical protein